MTRVNFDPQYPTNAAESRSCRLIWCAHIGLDRALGDGLKYATGFAYTHLGRIGQADPW